MGALEQRATAGLEVEPASSVPPPDVVPDGLIARPARAAHITFAVLFLTSTALTLCVIWPFGSPLFLGAVLASVLYGVFERLERWLRGRRSAAAAASTVALFFIIVGPVAAIIGFTAGQIVNGLAFVRERLGIHSVEQLQAVGFSPRGWVLVDRALVAAHLSRAQLAEWTNRAAAAAEEVAARVLAHSSTALVQTSIMLIAFYFFLLEGRRLIQWLWLVSPLQARQTRDLLDEFRGVSRATVLGAGLAALFQGAAATVGYLLAGVPNAVFFGMLTLITSFVPVVGTMLVWMPAVMLLWLFGHHAGAVLLLGWCLVFVVGAEQVGKPLVLRALLGGDHGRAHRHRFPFTARRYRDVRIDLGSSSVRSSSPSFWRWCESTSATSW